MTDNKNQAQQQSEAEDDVESSKTEKCLERFLAPNLLTTPGRIGIIVVYLFLIAGSIYGCTQVAIDFKVTYFIGETADIYNYF